LDEKKKVSAQEKKKDRTQEWVQRQVLNSPIHQRRRGVKNGLLAIESALGIEEPAKGKKKTQEKNAA